MIEIALVAVLIGAFLFLGCGLSVANSNKPEKVKNVLTVFLLLGLILFIGGFISVVIYFIMDLI